MRCKHVLAVMALLAAASVALAQEDRRAANPEPAKAALHAAPKKIIKRHARTASLRLARLKRAAAVKTVKTPLPPRRDVAKTEPTPLPPLKPEAAKAEPKTPLPQPRPEVAKLETTAPLPPPKPDAAKLDEKTPMPAPRPEAAKAEPEKSPPPAKPEPAKTAAKTEPAAPAVAAVVPDERGRIQAALAWAGDLSGDAKGEDPLTAAIKSYQKRNKAKTTGELTSDQRSALLAAARTHESEFGWSVMADPATGIRIGLPTKLVPQVHDAARGTRWSSAHGEFQIETFRIKGPDLKLAALFEQHKNEPNRKIANSALHDDSFFISGMQGLKDFSVRAQMRDGEIRGVMLMYDQAWEGIVAPVTGAVASSFAPFPGRGVPYAPLAKSVEYGSGLIVSAHGDIVTARKLIEGCKVILVPGLGNVEHVADDATSGLALLRIYGRGKLAPLALTNEAPKAGDVTLIGVPDPKEQSGPRLAEVKAQLAGSGAIELRRPMPVAGLAGGAALDAQARVLGMVDTRNAVLASAEATAAPVRLVNAGTIREFLARHQVTPAAAPGGDARDAIVRVVCVRK